MLRTWSRRYRVVFQQYYHHGWIPCHTIHTHKLAHICRLFFEICPILTEQRSNPHFAMLTHNPNQWMARAQNSALDQSSKQIQKSWVHPTSTLQSPASSRASGQHCWVHLHTVAKKNKLYLTRVIFIIIPIDVQQLFLRQIIIQCRNISLIEKVMRTDHVRMELYFYSNNNTLPLSSYRRFQCNMVKSGG